jgi:hypothetical protein
MVQAASPERERATRRIRMARPVIQLISRLHYPQVQT